jgi:hypothetical protein
VEKAKAARGESTAKKQPAKKAAKKTSGRSARSA